MEYRYTLNIEEDTNDADYINETTDLGVYDSDNKEDMDFIKFALLVLDCCELDDGYHTFDLETIKEGIKKADIDLKKIDKSIAKAYDNNDDEKLNSALEDYLWEWEPHMDNCDYSHDLSYTLTRVPADVIKEDVFIDTDTMELDFGDEEDDFDDDDEDDFEEDES